MFLQDVLTQAQGNHPEVIQRLLESLIPSLVVGLLAYFLGRKKNLSEANRNDSESEKNHAETVKVYIDMVAVLNEELSDWISQVKTFRDDADTMLGDNATLKRALRRSESLMEDKIDEVKAEFLEKKKPVLALVDHSIDNMNGLLNDLISHEADQVQRMKAVVVVESLYKLRDSFKKLC